MTFLELAEEVLKEAKEPLTYKQIWDNVKPEVQEEMKTKTKRINPVHTVEDAIYPYLRKENPKFMRVYTKPITIWLKEREKELPPILEKLKQKIQETQEKEIEEKYKFKERELHPLLVNFINNDEDFNIRAKTIHHESSKKEEKGKNKWNYPDIVGVRFPFDNEKMSGATLDLLQNINQIQYKLYSFELKIIINFSNLKECYFQAVSNSSWANEGYLVAFDIDENVIEELKRLNASFGIGVIQLDVEKLKPKVILPSSQRELDIETLNMLVNDSPDFNIFIEDINNIIKAKSSNLVNQIKDSFDKVFDSPEELREYIEKNIR
ncbi:HrgA protein [Brachyspira aalborgi]|uniref:HTH domain-containing protein n=1 Tax=Brachyspira aalborgi TaxID=29522 RepID=UPI0011C9D88A|nr:HTH domain-containing protein [Brachyspira aalborgi]TXJ14297.1 HrgA protein [Brachyspira aalborgi]TXJ19075.1 HrgA protein [Brachyspira aalborgi]TXJ47208.1 HrgA protein [Brachyspira aalborgi]